MNGRRRGFTLIELLIVIAIILITIAGEMQVLRLQTRSALVAHDSDVISSLLSSELAELRRQGVSQREGVLPLPIPLRDLSSIPKDMEGGIKLYPRQGGNLVEAEVSIRWKSVSGWREMTLATLLRVEKGGAP